MSEDASSTHHPATSTIRAATPDDVPDIVGLAISSGLFPADEADIVARLMTNYFQGRSDEGHACVVDDDGELLAVAYYEPAVATDGTWYLTMIAVRADRQGQGRGTTALRHIERALAVDGQRLLLVQTSGVAAFERTRAFYARAGYLAEARVRDYYEPGDDMIVFSKRLSGSDRDGR